MSPGWTPGFQRLLFLPQFYPQSLGGASKGFPSSPLSPGSLAKTLGPGTRLLGAYLLIPLFLPFQERKEEAPHPPRFLCMTPTTHPSLISPINENGLFPLPASRLTRLSSTPANTWPSCKAPQKTKQDLGEVGSGNSLSPIFPHLEVG